MDIRRRTYLLNLLSMGEVLYCGSPTISNTDYDSVVDYGDSYVKVLISNDVLNKYTNHLFMVLISDDGDDLDTNSLITTKSLFDLGTITFTGSGPNAVKLNCVSNYGGFVISISSGNDFGFSSRSYNAVIVVAIPRTDV